MHIYDDRGLHATLGLLAGLTFLLYVINKAVYNVYFHPLRSFPGPLAARVGSFWYAYHAWTGRLHVQVKKLHDIYGEVVRIAPNELCFNNGQGWQEIYGRSATMTEGYPKDPATFRASWGNGDMLTANEQDHRRLRRLQSHAFSEKALDSQADIIHLYISKLISKLNEKARHEKTAVVDLVNWYNFLTFDLIGDLAFGESFGCLDLGLLHPWIRGVFGFIKTASLYQALARIQPVLARLVIVTLYLPQAIAAKSHLGYSVGLARKRINIETDRPDFTSYILKHNDERGMTSAEIEAGASLLVLAGSETTSTSLAAATFYLLKNPSVMANLVREIRESFQREEDITMTSTASLSYLQAVIEESLRMVPPVPFSMPRISPPDRAISVCGHVIPAGTAIGISHWSAYTSEHNFRDPKRFSPGRWLGDPEFVDDDKRSFQPFSTGPRNCMGKNLAYAEMRLILAHMIWNFDMELQLDSQGWNEGQKIFLVWQKESLNVRLVKVVR